MWQTYRLRSKSGPYSTDAAELLQSTSRSLIAIIGVLYLAGHAVSTAVMPPDFLRKIGPVTGVVILTSGVALRLLRKQLLAAQEREQT